MYSSATLYHGYQSMTITAPVGKNRAMILVDPKQGKAKIVPLVEHGETVVKSSQEMISKCQGKGTILTAQGQTLLHFIKKHL